tara:strand:- start:82 stop:258 length:177 start_codon:yes stop_codon:yes gene_type:complete
MAKAIRILEVPIYLLVLAMGCYEFGAGGTALFLVIVSFARLFSNTITDEFIYKQKDKK